MKDDAGKAALLSIARGIPLAEEPGLGSLTLPGFLREVVDRHGDCEAIVWRGRGVPERWSYAELWLRSLEIARALLAVGVGRDARVGVLATNRPEQLASTFGVSLAGGVVVLVNTFATPRELEHMLTLSGAEILIFERHVAGKDFVKVLCELEPTIAEVGPGGLRSVRLPFLRRLVAIDEPASAPDASVVRGIETFGDFLEHGREIAPELIETIAETTRPADAAALFFSSGTTAMPKGILHAHRAIALQSWRWARLMGMEAPIRSWTANGFFFSGNLSMVAGGTLASGGTLILQSTFEPVEAVSLLQDERASFALCWPHQWQQLEGAANWPEADLSSLVYVKHDTPAARHPTVDTDWLLPPTYGQTETLTISMGLASDTPREYVAGCHGAVLPGNTAKIVDPESGEILRLGELGELAIKGPTLMLGYVGTPLDETLDDEGFLRTGDGGMLDAEGRFFWKGRLSDIIKTGGANVSPLEIDTVLLGHPAVKLAQSVGVPHETLGELVVSCVVLHEGKSLEEDELRVFARRQLSTYKVPRRVLFFEESEIESTGSAKVKTAFLREQSLVRMADEPGIVLPASPPSDADTA